MNLAVSGLPSGATASFGTNPINGSGSSTLTVTTASTTPPPHLLEGVWSASDPRHYWRKSVWSGGLAASPKTVPSCKFQAPQANRQFFTTETQRHREKQKTFATDERGSTRIFGRLWGPHLLAGIWSAQNRVCPASLLAKIGLGVETCCCPKTAPSSKALRFASRWPSAERKKSFFYIPPYPALARWANLWLRLRRSNSQRAKGLQKARILECVTAF